MTPRPFGEQLCKAVRLVHAQGPSSYNDIHLVGLARQNIHKVLSRGVGLGLLTTDRSVRPRTFSVVPDWEARLEDHATTRALAEECKPRASRRIAHVPPPAPPVYAFTSVWVQST